MSTFTKEQLIEKLQHRISVASRFPESEKAQMDLELARIALASLEAEPYGYVHKAAYEQAGSCGLSGDHEAYRDSSTHIAVYTATPAPVSVPDERAAFETFMEKRFKDCIDRRLVKNGDGEYFAWDMQVAWIAWQGHAAMLQAEPVSNSDELPLDYLQGHKDGLEWAAQLAEANHPQTGDWLYDDPIDLARAIRKGPDMPTVQAGNSPVTPDAWISCSERMPDDGQHVIILCDGAFVLYAQYRDSEFFDVVRNGEEFFETQSRNVTHWMPLPAAPRQEVK